MGEGEGAQSQGFYTSNQVQGALFGKRRLDLYVDHLK